MATKFLGFWKDEISIPERLKNPEECKSYLYKVHNEPTGPLRPDMTDDEAKKWNKSIAEIRGYVLVEDAETAG